MSDDADTRSICPRCLRTEHSPSCLRRQAFGADKLRPAIDPGSPADAADRIRAVLVAMVERTKGTDDRIAILTDALRAVEGR